MSRSNSVSPPGLGLRGGTEHRSAWGEREPVANGCPARPARSSGRWREVEGRGTTTTTIAPGKTRLSLRSKSAWQERGDEGGVRAKSVELGLDERRARTKEEEMMEEEEEEGRGEEERQRQQLAPDARAFSAAACCSGVMRVFSSKKFRSEKLERLYQRYFFRLNQSSLTMLMAVLALVCAVMLCFHCAGGPCHTAYVLTFSLAIVLVLALMLACNRSAFHQDHMWLVCYAVIAVLLVLQAVGVLLVSPRSASDGVWWTVFFIHVVYTLLPVRMRAAVATGVALAAIHVVGSWKLNEQDELLWKQVSGRARLQGSGVGASLRGLCECAAERWPSACVQLCWTTR
ncbi:hypothetical protein SRHO_G00110860 [Serrasalmus rhombeus]